MTEDVAQNPEWDARVKQRDLASAEAELRARVADTVEAMGTASAAGVNVQGVVMEMMVAAFAAQGEEVPPLLKMLLA